MSADHGQARKVLLEHVSDLDAGSRQFEEARADDAIGARAIGEIQTRAT
jgi:hypothetical protein